MNFCHPSRRSGHRYVPAVGYALLLPAVGPLFSCLLLAMLFSPAVGPLFYPLWVRSFSFFSSRSSTCSRSLKLLCSLPRRRCLRMRLSRPASAVHTVFCSVVPWFVKGLRCSLAVVMALHEPLPIFMALHESLAMALHGFPASLSTC